jgi:hypothetical protein
MKFFMSFLVACFFAATGLMAGVIATQPIPQVTVVNTHVGILGNTVFPQVIAIDTGQKANLVADNSVMKKSTSSSNTVAYLIKAEDVTFVENSASGTAETLVWTEGQSKIDSKQTI